MRPNYSISDEDRNLINKQKEELQVQFCSFMSSPLVAPEGGLCPSCGIIIWEFLTKEQVSNQIVCNCPKCGEDFLG